MDEQGWANAARQLAVLDGASRAGAVIVLKIDGERSENRYTLVVNSVRKDGDDLQVLLSEAIAAL